MSTALPRIAICSDRIVYRHHAANSVSHSYVRAVQQFAEGLPWLWPVGMPEGLDACLLEEVDGVVLTGSASNVAPACYGAAPAPAGTLEDEERDQAVLRLIPRIIAHGIPLLAICRGFQEMNVAYGGTLHPAVHEQPGALDHREGDHSRPLADWYALSHPVRLRQGGILQRGCAVDEVRVNSLHEQGVAVLGAGLTVEAVAPDGLIEAFCDASAPGFNLAVQWHPEALVGQDALSTHIFTTFGAACRVRQQQRTAVA